MREMLPAMLTFVARLFRRKLLFLMALAFTAVLGALSVNGWSWTGGIVVAVAIIVVGLFWILSSFWLWVFGNMNRERRP